MSVLLYVSVRPARQPEGCIIAWYDPEKELYLLPEECYLNQQRMAEGLLMVAREWGG